MARGKLNGEGAKFTLLGLHWVWTWVRFGVKSTGFRELYLLLGRGNPRQHGKLFVHVLKLTVFPRAGNTHQPPLINIAFVLIHPQLWQVITTIFWLFATSVNLHFLPSRSNVAWVDIQPGEQGEAGNNQDFNGLNFSSGGTEILLQVAWTHMESGYFGMY